MSSAHKTNEQPSGYSQTLKVIDSKTKVKGNPFIIHYLPFHCTCLLMDQLLDKTDGPKCCFIIGLLKPNILNSLILSYATS